MKALIGIIVLGVLIGTGFYYRDALSSKISNLTIAHTPSPAPVSTSVVTLPAPVATPKPTVTPVPFISIAQIDNNGKPLPTTGPELDFAIAGGVGLLGGSGLYYAQLRRRLRASLKNIDVQ